MSKKQKIVVKNFLVKNFTHEGRYIKKRRGKRGKEERKKKEKTEDRKNGKKKRVGGEKKIERDKQKGAGFWA